MKWLCDIKTGQRMLKEEKALWGTSGSETAGIYAFFFKQQGEIHVIATAGDGWDHVSVSAQHRTPTWEEMETIKRIFFRDEETAMQLHVPVKDHINCNPNVLHMWRPQRATIPMPPKVMV